MADNKDSGSTPAKAVSAFKPRKSVKHTIAPEDINRQSAGGPRLYRVWEVYNMNLFNPFSMLFNVKEDAEAVADWHNETRSISERFWSVQYKIRERRVYSGIRHACTQRSTGLPPFPVRT